MGFNLKHEVRGVASGYWRGRLRQFVALHYGYDSTKGGFTLIEVLIAVFILALILGSVYSAFFVIYDATSSTTGTVVRLQEARTTMDLMRRELEAGIDPKKSPMDVSDRDLYGRQTSSLLFDTFGSALAGGSRVGYSIKEAEDGRLSLIKTVGPVEEDMFEVSRDSVEVEAVEDVVSFMVEVQQSQDKWIKTWRENNWPKGIRVTLTIKLHGAEVPLVFTASPYVGEEF